MRTFAGLLARRALDALPVPSRVRELIEELEPKARASLDALGEQLVELGAQLQQLAGSRLLPAGAAAGAHVAAGAQVAAPGATHSEGWAIASFSISHAATSFGEHVFVAGDQPALGNWDVTRALPLIYQSSGVRGGGPDAAWTRRTTLPASAGFQYKYVRWNPLLPAATARWEADQPTRSRNREAQTCGAGGTTVRLDGRFHFG
jgi:Starch binding domain